MSAVELRVGDLIVYTSSYSSFLYVIVGRLANPDAAPDLEKKWLGTGFFWNVSIGRSLWNNRDVVSVWRWMGPDTRVIR